MELRIARQADLPRLLEIYNYEVTHGVATLDIHPQTMGQRQAWFDAHNVENHPLYVAEQNGVVAGYASLSAYREKEAFASTVELSIYVAPECRRQGVAAALMKFILQKAREDARTHNVVSVITAGNEVSIKLHERFGFTFCGTVPEVGAKFGRLLDIDHYSLIV